MESRTSRLRAQVDADFGLLRSRQPDPVQEFEHERAARRRVDDTIITAMVEKLRANERRTKTPKRRRNTSVSGRK
jgi:hypothetical protein